MGFTSKVTSSSNLHNLMKRLKKMDGMTAEAGYYDQKHPDSDLNMATLALVHERGSPKQNIPERPFMTQAFVMSVTDRGEQINFVREVVYLGVHPTRCIKKVAERLQKDIAIAITMQNFAELKPDTIRKKQARKLPLPTAKLIATGALIGKVKAKVNQKD